MDQAAHEGVGHDLEGQRGQRLVLVGHSMGAGFWVRYLSEHPNLTVDKVVLVAPWLNVNHEMDTDFFNFEIDQSITGRVNELIIFSSDNDGVEMQDSIKLLQEKLPKSKTVDFHEYGHFTRKSMGTDAFPELLKAVL